MQVQVQTEVVYKWSRHAQRVRLIGREMGKLTTGNNLAL